VKGRLLGVSCAIYSVASTRLLASFSGKCFEIGCVPLSGAPSTEEIFLRSIVYVDEVIGIRASSAPVSYYNTGWSWIQAKIGGGCDDIAMFFSRCVCYFV
jgi:hypothetical protein